MRIVAIGDVGVLDRMMHIGDEAMFEALADELRARGADIVAVSSNPAETAARYGVEAVPRIRFDGLDRQASQARMAAVLATAAGDDALDADDPARRVIDAVAGADGVVVAGGGNLASTWPLHVYERATLTGIAQQLGRPVVVTGQTFGPALNERDRALVGGMLREARLVGAREHASAALAAELGATARVGVDDASFLALDRTAIPTEREGVLVSLSLSLGGTPRAEAVERIARLVDAAADVAGGPVRFHAHFGPEDGSAPRGDALLHEEVRALMRSASVVVPTGDSAGAAALARSSALLVTGRYHPAVFAAPAGVPVLGLTTDDYTRVKQRGALAHWGQSTTVPLGAADSDGTGALETLWSARARVREAAALALPLQRADARAWWDDVAATFG